MRELTGDDPLWERIDTDPNSRERMAFALAIWKFVKSPDRLTPVSQLGDTWIPSIRKQLANLIEEIGLQCHAKLGHHIKTTGLSDAQKALPLFESVHEFPEVRQNTIHQVKGESIDAVLVIGSTKFWNSVMAAGTKWRQHGRSTAGVCGHDASSPPACRRVTEWALRQALKDLGGVGLQGGDVMDARNEPDEQRCCFRIRA